MIHALASWAIVAAFSQPVTHPGIEETLRHLEAAARAGDKAAWLAVIPHGDAEWRMEQAYFANDLGKKPVEALDISVKDVEESDGCATGEVTFEWNMPGKAKRSVTFDARFVEEGGRWLYAGEVWEGHEAPGVVVLCGPGLDVLAERAVEAFSAVRPRVDAFFGHEDPAFTTRVQKIKIYGAMSHLQQSICLSYEDGLAGWNEPEESIKLLAGRNSTVKGLSTLLAHEYGHVATFASGPKSNDVMPWWVLEGAAELAAEHTAGGRSPEKRVASWAKKGNLAPWPALADFETIDHKWYGHVYTQGHSMVRYIHGEWEREGMIAWLRAMGAGKELDEATHAALGISFEELDARWRGTLPAREEEAKKEE